MTDVKIPIPVSTLEQDGMKILKPPQICTFSGNEPVLKEEGSYDQWEFQVRGAMATHTENSVRAAIVNLLRGPARDLVGFLGFDVELERILEEVTNQFGWRYTGDKLQLEFYQLWQEKGEKIQVFTSCLELIYRCLHDKLPEQFSEEQLRDRLFYGVDQSLHDSSQYLYKEGKVTYQVFLAALDEMESKYSEGKMTARNKSAAVDREAGIAELRERIEALTTVVKSNNITGRSSSLAKNKDKFQKKGDHSKQPSEDQKTRY